jgi:hypothetical protein
VRNFIRSIAAIRASLSTERSTSDEEVARRPICRGCDRPPQPFLHSSSSVLCSLEPGKSMAWERFIMIAIETCGRDGEASIERAGYGTCAAMAQPDARHKITASDPAISELARGCLCRVCRPSGTGGTMAVKLRRVAAIRPYRNSNSMD